MSLNLKTFVHSKVTSIYLMKNAAAVPIFGFTLVRKTMWLIRLETFVLRQPYLEVFKQKYPIRNDSK